MVLLLPLLLPLVYTAATGEGGYMYQALAGPCAPAGAPMTIVNATSLADCQSQCTKQRDGFNGCAAALEKLCGSVFRACPAFPCSTCEACTAEHKAALSSAGCDIAEAGCVAPGCAGIMTDFCIKPPAAARPPAHAKAAPWSLLGSARRDVLAPEETSEYLSGGGSSAGSPGGVS